MSTSLPRWQGAALVLITAWLYASILEHLFLQWVGDPNFQHGIFVPVFALFVVWEDRNRLKAIPPTPSWAGLPLVAISLCVLVLGVLGADIFLPRVSLLILLAGLIILFLGWAFFRAVLFPWAFLILMIPIPALLINRVTFPLQLLASRLAAEALRLINTPVLLQGNCITLPNGRQLDVAEACSGIRSLLTLVTLAIIYGYLMEKRTWVRVVLACSAIPIAVVTNGFRVFSTGVLVQNGHGDAAEGMPHAIEGLLVFAAALVLVFALHRVILRFWKSGPAATRNPSDNLASVSERRPGTPPKTAGSFRFSIVAVPMLATAIGLQAHPGREIIPPHDPPSSLPTQIGDWKSAGADGVLDKDTLDILGHPEYVVRDYENTSQEQPWINLFIPYYDSQKAGDTIHSPEHCLPGAGWIPISRQVIRLPRPDGSSYPVNRFVVAKGADRQLVLYWFQAHGRAVASEWAAKYYLISDAIHMNRSDGGLVRLMTPMLNDESPDAAQARVMKLGSQILPLLDTVIPR